MLISVINFVEPFGVRGKNYKQMKKIISKLSKLFQIELSESEINSLPSDEIRRIKMVNTISLIGILSLSFYGILYCFIDASTYFVAISFYFTSAILTFGILQLNKQRHFNLAKTLLILIFPLYIAIDSTLFFGKVANSQVYILLFALIPLFVYSYKQKSYLIGFIGLNLIIYCSIEFFPTFTEPIYKLPSNYTDFFRSMNVFIAFMGAFIAILFFKKFSNQIEEQLIKQSDELKKSQVHRDLVYSIIAHDLRSPFNGLMGISELLVSKIDSLEKEKTKNYLVAMNNSANNLNSLLVNLLDWTKMQSGNLKTNFQPFQLKETIDEVIILLNDLMEGKKLKLTNEIIAESIVFADLYMVSTIARNLLTNAIKFTSQGGTIVLKSKVTGSFIEISVADSGIGIPENIIDNLFNSNSNYNANGTNNEKGSGLGLKICSDFVIAHGGNIWVESQANEGSCFYFTLPTQS